MATGQRFGIPLTAEEFQWIRRFLRERTGITLNDTKRSLVMGRLEKRLRHHGLTDYSQYFRLLGRPEHAAETQLAIDLLTTNETYFFREPEHFDLLRDMVRAGTPSTRMFRVWSAACSTGEEPYTLAMVLADLLPENSWEILATDISERVLRVAERGVYPLAAAEKIPQPLLKKYCLRGREDCEDLMAVSRSLRSHVTFRRLNLVTDLPDLGVFDVVFLRNVMIYFEVETKEELVRRIARLLRPGGYLVVSHSESLHGMEGGLDMVKPSVYRAPVGARV